MRHRLHRRHGRCTRSQWERLRCQAGSPVCRKHAPLWRHRRDHEPSGVVSAISEPRRVPDGLTERQLGGRGQHEQRLGLGSGLGTPRFLFL